MPHADPEAARAYRQRPDVRARRRAATDRYARTEKGRAAQARADARRDPEKRRQQVKEAHARRRARAVAALGGKCEVCGTTDRLEIHHANFDGAEDRARRSLSKITTAVIRGEPGYRLLRKTHHEGAHHDCG